MKQPKGETLDIHGYDRETSCKTFVVRA